MGSTEKIFSLAKFWIPVSIMIMLGIISLKHSDESNILNRNITDEWKGSLIVFNPYIFSDNLFMSINNIKDDPY